MPPAYNEKELAEHYRWADVFLLPSRWEGVPLTLLEAMAFGTIVISTDVGGVSEIVRDGDTGFVVPAGATEGEIIMKCVEAIAAESRDPKGYADIRERAVREALGTSWTSTARTLASVIEELAGMAS
jgi:glycosyltransferase involved in cell wall biosynthesis